MRLHLETFSGIAGNMFLGALLDAGLSARALREDLAGLGVAHTLRVRKVQRGALAARYVSVGVPRATARKKKGKGHPKGEHHHHAHGRHYDEIRRILDRAKLAAPVRDRAQAIFLALAEAEAAVHGVRLEKVHFHEVGAVDAIVDVTGAAIGLERLGVGVVTATPPALGHGTVETEHGLLPLPAPATMELLRGVPTRPAAVAWETVTPTGAAILRTITDSYRELPAMTPLRVGYGAGDDRKGPMPNVLRAILGRGEVWEADRVASLEANLDDFVPEHFDHVMERLLAAGALDVSLQHVQTKKNRPGFLLRILARPEDRSALATLLFAETPTLGVRVTECDRWVLPRRTVRVDTPYGRIRVKIAEGPTRVEVSAEYDDCKRAADRHQTPLRDIIRTAEDRGRSSFVAFRALRRGRPR